jgi:hypothetical protein
LHLHDDDVDGADAISCVIPLSINKTGRRELKAAIKPPRKALRLRLLFQKQARVDLLLQFSRRSLWN